MTDLIKKGIKYMVKIAFEMAKESYKHTSTLVKLV